MPYANKYTIFELSGYFPEQELKLWNCWSIVVPQSRREQMVIDTFVFPDQNGPPDRSFESSFDPTGPTPSTYMAVSIQDRPLAATDQGWLFRSGRYLTLPSEEIEIVTAPQEIINQASINASISGVTLPMVMGTTSINTITATLTLTGINFMATGTDSRIPGITLSYTATTTLTPNADLTEVDEPLDVGLSNTVLAFIPGPGAGFSAAILNAFTGCFLQQVNPMVRRSLSTIINAGIIRSVAQRFSMTATTLPAGVIVSIRRMIFRADSSGAPEIQVLGALGAFGGVLNKFPRSSSTSTCFIATASTSENSPEVVLLRQFREIRLRPSPLGRIFIKNYERLSPPVALMIRRSNILKYFVANLFIKPIARVAKLFLKK